LFHLYIICSNTNSQLHIIYKFTHPAKEYCNYTPSTENTNKLTIQVQQTHMHNTTHKHTTYTPTQHTTNNQSIIYTVSHVHSLFSSRIQSSKLSFYKKIHSRLQIHIKFQIHSKKSYPPLHLPSMHYMLII